MYKKILIPTTNLLQPVTKSANVLPVPVSISDYIAAALGPDDWTYLRVSQGQKIEIVRVIAATAGKLYVVRGIEQTTSQAFGIEAILDYALTAQEIRDSVEVDRLVLNSLGSIRISKGRITIPDIKLYGLGGVADGLPIQERIEAECCGKTREPPEIDIKYWPVRKTGDSKFRVTSEGDYRITR